ncbi:L,D-transpeptidase [Alphaproteobacteria bacterium LSUCC0684]
MLFKVQAEGEGFVLKCGSRRIPCRIGRNGIIPAGDKREGDGCTPAGDWSLRSVFFRADRLDEPRTSLECRPITRLDGWCDEGDHPAYNTLVQLPFAASHEALWRQDGAYDIIVVLGYNDDPVQPHRGSAIFFHCLAEGQTETAGCVAIRRDDMLEVLAMISADAVMLITI